MHVWLMVIGCILSRVRVRETGKQADREPLLYTEIITERILIKVL